MIAYAHMDVFTDVPLGGNGLAVVFCDGFFAPGVMLNLAREFKQFETIFVTGFDGQTVLARIFTVEGELPFAGHPLLGAAAALHGRFRPEAAELPILFRLPGKTVPTFSQRTGTGFQVWMRQGPPVFLGPVPREALPWLAAAHSLAPADLDPALPPEVVSTGLAYLLLPVRGCLARARIAVADLEARIAAFGAAYTYLFDAEALEARTWDNLGLVEDAATGSAAGPLRAYLEKHGRVGPGEPVVLRQGRFANRPSLLTAWTEEGEVYVSGGAVLFAQGAFSV